MQAQPGRPAARCTVRLELKLIADIGLVGEPNAGKSTLLSVLTAARPKVADYPFTTLVPNLGIVDLGDYSSCTLADIPGLIEGASEGRGLGHEFLRHVERTRALLLLVDPSFEAPGRALDVLRGELACHGHRLTELPFAVAVTKRDLLDEEAAGRGPGRGRGLGPPPRRGRGRWPSARCPARGWTSCATCCAGSTGRGRRAATPTPDPPPGRDIRPCPIPRPCRPRCSERHGPGWPTLLEELHDPPAAPARRRPVPRSWPGPAWPSSAPGGPPPAAWPWPGPWAPTWRPAAGRWSAAWPWASTAPPTRAPWTPAAPPSR